MLMLRGEVDDRDQRIELLTREVERLEGELRAAKLETEKVRAENGRAISALRKQLAPLFRALQMVFGEIDAVSEGDVGVPQADTKWESVKQRLAPRLRDAIDILLVQKAMKRTQLAAALRMDYSNCNKNVIGVLLRQGLLLDNGRELSLKEL